MTSAVGCILGAVAEIIAGKVPALQNRVEVNRNPALVAENMPRACVLVQRQTPTLYDLGPRAWIVSIEFGVEILIAVGAGDGLVPAEGADEILFALCEEVTRALDTEPTLRELLSDFAWTGQDFATLEPAGDVYFLGALLSYTGRYMVQAPAPNTSDAAPLKTVRIDMDLAPPADGVRDSRDNVTLNP